MSAVGTDPQVRVHLLGALEVLVGGSAVALGGPRPRRLLGVLALSARTAVTTSRLVDTVWDGEPPASAANAVQVYVSRLRRALAVPGAGSVLRAAAGGYLLDVPADAVDVHRFERLADAGHARLAAGDPAEASRLLREGLQLWRGPALPDLAELSSADGLLARLESRRLATLADRFDADAALGRAAVLVPELEEAVRIYPLDERFVAQLVTALYRAGRQSDALAAYTAAADRLADELGIDPGPALRELHGKVLRQEVSLPAAAPPPAPAPRQAVLLPQPRQVPLDRPRTRLVGRTGELAQVAALLERDDIRLLTLLGPGGTGKTRLATELVGTLRAGGGREVVVVALAAVTDPDGVLPAVCRAAGSSPEWAGEPPLDVACRALGGREILLVLDNLEQLVGLPGDERGGAVGVVVELLDALPGLTVLCTSRTVLRVRGEHVLALAPLPLPDPADGDALEAVLRSPAVQLFVERATAAMPEFELTAQNAAAVAGVCRMLDGLPLALELAAARVRMLPPEQMLRREQHRLRLLTGGPRDLPERQRSMRDTLDWSAQLLDAAEARLFAQLSVFAGGWTLDAAEHVGELAGEDDVVDVIARLVERSLVSTDGGGRLAMLQTVREYAAEKLAGDPRQQRATRDRHADCYAGVAEQFGPMYRTAQVHEDRERMDVETANLSAALEHAGATGDVPTLARLVVGLLDYWFHSGQLEQADRWVAVARDAEVPAEVRARLLLSTAGLTLMQGDLQRARTVLASAHVAALEQADPLLIARALAMSALAARHSGELDRSLDLLEQAIDAAEQAGRSALVEPLHNERGELLDALGRTDEALPLWRRFRQWAGDDHGERAYALVNLALHAQEHGDPGTARELITDAIRSAVEGDAVPMRADVWVAAGLLELRAGRARLAVDLLREGIALTHDCGQLLTLADAVSLLGAALAVTGDAAAAARLLGAGQAWREARGLAVVGRLQRQVIETADADVAAALSAEDLAVERGRGARTPYGSLSGLRALAPAVVDLSGSVVDLGGAGIELGQPAPSQT